MPERRKLPTLNLEVNGYLAVGGGIYHDISQKAWNTTWSQEIGDVTAVIMGSNYIRWMADKTYKQRFTTASQNSP